MKVIASAPKSKISLTLAASAIPDAIRVVSKVAKTYVIVNVNDQGAFMIGYDSEGNCAIVRLPTSELKGQGSFLIEPDTIQPVCTNRKSDIVFTYTEGVLQFQAVKGKYNGTLSLKPLVLDVVNNINDLIEAVNKQSDILTPETYAAMWTSLGYARISDVFDPTKNQLVRYIQAYDDVVEVSSFDNFHMSLVTTKLEGGAQVRAGFKLAVTDKYIENLSNTIEANERGVKFVVTDHTFSARSPDALLYMPPNQAQDGYDIARSYIMSDEVEYQFDCTLPAGRLKTVVENCCAVYKAGSTIAVSSQPNYTLSFEMRTEYGEVADEVQLDTSEGAVTFSLEPYSFLDVINLLGDEDQVRLRVSQGVCYLIEFNSPLTSVMLMGSLHADSEE